jgi:DNA-binding response OmpR family regulator
MRAYVSRFTFYTDNMSKATILVIDDDPASVNVLIKYLQSAGFRTLAAPSGERALRQLKLAQPDLILLDVLMPGIDGFETCCRLKEQEAFRDIPVIFMTALSDTVDKVKGFEVGAVDYITKPLQHEEVLARINAHLTIRKLQQQLQEQNFQLEEQNTLLEEQNERFRKLSEATFEGILIHDKGLILESSQRLEQMFGYQRSEVLGKNVLDFVAPASRDVALQYVQIADGSSRSRPDPGTSGGGRKRAAPKGKHYSQINHERSLQVWGNYRQKPGYAEGV